MASSIICSNEKFILFFCWIILRWFCSFFLSQIYCSRSKVYRFSHFICFILHLLLFFCLVCGFVKLTLTRTFPLFPHFSVIQKSMFRKLVKTFTAKSEESTTKSFFHIAHNINDFMKWTIYKWSCVSAYLCIWVCDVILVHILISVFSLIVFTARIFTHQKIYLHLGLTTMKTI